MTPVERQENDSTKLINTDMSVKERIRVYIADIAAKLSSLPKKHKAAILTTLVLLIMLIPLSAYLLSPVNATEIQPLFPEVKQYRKNRFQELSLFLMKCLE